MDLVKVQFVGTSWFEGFYPNQVLPYDLGEFELLDGMVESRNNGAVKFSHAVSIGQRAVTIKIPPTCSSDFP